MFAADRIVEEILRTAATTEPIIEPAYDYFTGAVRSMTNDLDPVESRVKNLAGLPLINQIQHDAIEGHVSTLCRTWLNLKVSSLD
jgi:hypothetical protein